MSKVIFKLTFKHPNLKDTVSKNISHVKYISTRSGVDKTITEADLKNELEKGIEVNSSDNKTYAKYINERPRSHGLFDKDGIADLKEVQNEIANVRGYVWRGIISLKEDDANKLGYISKEKWEDMLRKKLPDIAREMKIGISNLRWVAAVHMEKGHPHAHVMIWEKVPRRNIGVISNKAVNKIRKLLTDEIFEDERLQLLNEKNAMRDLIKDIAKGDISKTTLLLKDVKASGLELKAYMEEMNHTGVSPKLYNKSEFEIADMIKKLGEKMPHKGRISLGFMPEDIKKEVRSIADYLLNQDVFSASLAKNLNAVEELTKLYTGKEQSIKVARDKAYMDIRDRVCQIILKGAAESQKQNLFYVDNELSQKAVNYIKNLSNNIDNIPLHNDTQEDMANTFKTLSTALLVSGISVDETKDIIHQCVIKINSNIGADDINNLVEHSYKVIENNNLWGKITVISPKEWESMFNTFGITENNMPKWIYKGVNWSNGLKMGSIVNIIWKSAWNTLERQHMYTVAQAELMRQHMFKHQAMTQNKSAIKEQMKKNKDHVLYKDDEIQF